MAQVVAIMGPSGAGKTTLLYALMSTFGITTYYFITILSKSIRYKYRVLITTKG